MTRRGLIAAMAAFGALGAAGEYDPPPAKDGYAYPDCYCTNRGARVEMGQTVCMTVDGRSFLARCEMSLNNPTWREIQAGCPSAEAPRPPSIPERLERLQQG